MSTPKDNPPLHYAAPPAPPEIRFPAPLHLGSLLASTTVILATTLCVAWIRLYRLFYDWPRTYDEDTYLRVCYAVLVLSPILLVYSAYQNMHHRARRMNSTITMFGLMLWLLFIGWTLMVWFGIEFSRGLGKGR